MQKKREGRGAQVKGVAAILAIGVVTMLMMAGCGNAGSSTSEGRSEAPNMSAGAQSSGQGDDHLGAYTQEEIDGTTGFYLKRGDSFYESQSGFEFVDDFGAQDDYATNFFRSYRSTTDYDEELVPSGEYIVVNNPADQDEDAYLDFDRSSGDEVVFCGFDKDECQLYSIYRDGYWPGFGIDIDTDPEVYDEDWNEYVVSNLGIGGEDIDVAEIDGIDVTNAISGDGDDEMIKNAGADAALKTLTANGFEYSKIDITVALVSDGGNNDDIDLPMITSDEPDEFEVGYYQRSTYDSAWVELSDFLYVAKAVDCETSRTRDGYFVLETSGLAAGKYLAVAENPREEACYIAFEVE